MASYVERTSSGIIYQPAETRTFPQLDLLTLVFDSEHGGAKEDAILHADAVDPTKSITKSQLRSLVKKVAHTLRNVYGIGQHGPNKDVTLCIATGHFHLATIFFATIAAGGIYSASTPSSTPKELATQLSQVDAKAIFCTQDTKPTALAAAKLVNLDPSRVLVLGTGHDFELVSGQDTGKVIPLSTSLLDWPRPTFPAELEESIICLIFSSGTTGAPKACRISHANMVSEACSILDAQRRADPDLTWGKRTVAHLPVSHIAGIQSYFVNQSYAGGTVYWMVRFDFAKFLEYCKKYAVTGFFSVPPIYLLIAKSPAVTDQFDSVLMAISGAAPMGPDLQMAVSKKLGRGKAQVGQVWGLSETTGAMTSVVRGAENDVTGSVSMLVANGQARIVDDDGKDVEPGQPGEIWVRGPQVTKGYWKNEVANREAFVDGWFCTGDVGVFRDGKFYIVDRKKELIKYKGIQVAPAELEALLISHPKILDAAVIGVPGEDTEVPRAYIVADANAITAQDVADWVGGQVANHKKLRGGVFFLPAIPKSPSGKILRKDLRELAKKQAKESKL